MQRAGGPQHQVSDREDKAHVNPHDINPQQGLDRLQKLMDEYCGGYTVGYMTDEKLLNICLKKLKLMEEDLESVAAKDLHELLRARIPPPS